MMKKPFQYTPELEIALLACVVDHEGNFAKALRAMPADARGAKPHNARDVRDKARLLLSKHRQRIAPHFAPPTLVKLDAWVGVADEKLDRAGVASVLMKYDAALAASEAAFAALRQSL